MSSFRKAQPLESGWRAVEDPSRSGERLHWDSKVPGEARPVAGPSAFPFGVQGGVHWYFCAFEAAPPLPDSTADVRIGAGACDTDAWLNGVHLGRRYAPWQPARLPAGEALRPGENLLVLRLAMPRIPARPDPGVVWTAPPLTPGAVSLDWRPRDGIERVSIRPDPRRKRLVVEVSAPPGEVAVEIENGPRMSGKPGPLALPVAKLTPWAPDRPAMHRLRVEWSPGGQPIDEMDTTFGVREVGLRDGRFELNRKTFRLRGVACYPCPMPGESTSGATARLRDQLQRARDAGFNAVRFVVPPSVSQVLTTCDELGLLAWIDLPLPDWKRSEDDDPIQAARAIVDAYAHHPSVVFWGTRQGADTHAADTLAVALHASDGTRLIWHMPASPRATGVCLQPGSDAPEPAEEVAFDAAPPLCDGMAALAGRVKSACTTLALAPVPPVPHAPGGDLDEGLRGLNLARAFPDGAAFIDAVRAFHGAYLADLVAAFQRDRDAMGYVVGPLQPGLGAAQPALIDAQGASTRALEALAAQQDAAAPHIQLTRTNLVPREDTRVRVRLAEDRLSGERADLSLQVVGPTGQVLWKKKRSVRVPPPNKDLWEGTVASSGTSGGHRFVVRLMKGMQCLTEGSVALHVVPRGEAAEATTAFIGPQSRYARAAASYVRRSDRNPAVYIVPPLANTVRAYPPQEMAEMLAAVREGAAALWLEPPEDIRELAEHLGESLPEWLPADPAGASADYYAAPLHPVFEGLPTRGLLGAPYRNVLPDRAYRDSGGARVFGCYRYPGEGGDGPHWRSGMATLRHGTGEIVLSPLRIFRNLEHDPLAGRLLANLVRHAAQRSVPSTDPVRVDPGLRDWLRRRHEGVLLWRVAGPFRKRRGEDAGRLISRDTLQADTVFPGEALPLRWVPWYTLDDTLHHLDLASVLADEHGAWAGNVAGDVLVWAEFHCDQRRGATLTLETSCALEVSLNARTLYQRSEPEARPEPEEIAGMMREGRNTLVLRVEKPAGPADVRLNLSQEGGMPARITWWH